jgi:hypothetical protein
MTTQVTNRSEGGLTSCYGPSRKVHAFTKKELETVKAAQKLLGAPTIFWWGEYLGRGWWWRELQEANKPPSRPKYTKTAPKMGGFEHLMT